MTVPSAGDWRVDNDHFLACHKYGWAGAFVRRNGIVYQLAQHIRTINGEVCANRAEVPAATTVATAVNANTNSSSALEQTGIIVSAAVSCSTACTVAPHAAHSLTTTVTAARAAHTDSSAIPLLVLSRHT